MLDGHGDDLYRYGRDIRLNFSSNVRPGGPPAGLREAIHARFDECAGYPDPMARQLAAKIAEHHGLDPSSVIVTAGTVEGIYLLATAFRRGKAVIAIPTFSEYGDACRAHEIETHTILWPTDGDGGPGLTLPGRALLPQSEDVRAFRPDLFFLCNPNNPTGDLLALNEIRGLVESLPETLFVLDEAYIDFAPDAESALPLLMQHGNLVLLRSLTKSFAIPGLRLGYMMASPDRLERLREFRLPWSVSVPAIIAGEHILAHYKELRLDAAPLIRAKDSLSQEISRLPGYFPRRSRTHYFLVRTERGTASSLKEALAREKGILIRDASNFAGLDGGWFRVAARSEEENRSLVKALDEWRG